MPNAETIERVVKVTSPKGLSEETTRVLTRKLLAASRALDKAAVPAIEAWVWAFEHGHTKYRPTLKIAGVEPNGWLQNAHKVARAMHTTGTDIADMIEGAGSATMADLAKFAHGILDANGEIKKPNRRVRTALESAAKLLDYIKSLAEQMNRPASERADKNPACPRLKDLPTFNAHECIVAIMEGREYSIVLATDLDTATVREAVEAAAP